MKSPQRGPRREASISVSRSRHGTTRETSTVGNHDKNRHDGKNSTTRNTVKEKDTLSAARANNRQKKLKTETKRVTRLPGQICQIRPRRGRCL